MPATRAQYQRALCLLPIAWPRILRHHPKTSSDVHVIVANLLAKQPGRIMRQGIRKKDPRKGDGLAEELTWSRLRVFRAIDEARELGLILCLRYTTADELPTKRKPKTNILRYFVRADVIERYAFDGSPHEPSDGSPGEPSTGSLRSRDTSTPTPSRAAHRSPRRSQAPSAPRVAGETSPSAPDCPSDSTKTDRANDESLRRPGEQNAHHIAALASRWDALGLRNANSSASTCGPSERSALTNRVADVGLELVELAIDGAGIDPWLRNGGPRSALAWVMHNAGSVRRYAERGAAAKGAAEHAAVAAAEQAQRDSLWARCPWIPRTAPAAFREAMDRGDFAAAEAVLTSAAARPPDSLVDAGEASDPLAIRRHQSRSAADAPARICPTVARNFAHMLERAADLEEFRGAAEHAPLIEPGANDT